MNVSISEELYQQQLAEKLQFIKEILTPFQHPEISVFSSPIENFRMRAEFRIWHNQKKLEYAMFKKVDNKSIPYFINQFPIANQRINELMPLIIDACNSENLLAYKLFQIDFLTSLANESIVTFHYHRQLDETWLITAKQLSKTLNIKIVGRAKKQKLFTNEEYIIEKLEILGKTYQFLQMENSFTQPNAIVNQKMISWACQQVKDTEFDLLELYCGNGNFTIPFSDYFRKVFATEINKSSIYALKHNLQANKVENLTVARLSADEVTEAITGVRLFNRLENVNLASYQFNSVFVDPPRAGLDQKTCQFISQFPHITYVSCNPLSLLENLHFLSKTHKITACAIFDQFPYTPHIESAVKLIRK